MTDFSQTAALSPDSTTWTESQPADSAGPGDHWQTIGETARQFGVTERALRFYEAKGLLVPSRDGACRRYGPRERKRLEMLLKAKKLGFTLTEIGQMIAQAGSGVLDIGRRQCVEQIRHLEQRKREIESALAELRQAYSSLYMHMAPAGG